jgi:hypothetical protein
MANTTVSVEEDQSSVKLKPIYKDTFSYYALILFGFCTGLPWSVVTNSGRLFEEKLRGTIYGDAFLSHFATIFLAVKVLFLLVSVRLQTFLKAQNQILISIPILSVLLFLFAIICSLDYSNQFLFYILNLSLSLFVSFFSALFKGGTFSMVGRLSSYYLKALFIGEGMSSVFMALYSLILSFAFCPRQSCSILGFVSFGMSSLIIIFSLFIFLAVKKRPLFVDNPIENDSEEFNELAVSSIWILMQKVYPEIVAACFSGLVSLFIFPYLIAQTESSFKNHHFYSQRLFRPLSFLIFCAGDLVGKSLPAMITFCPNRFHLMKIVLGRLAFVPLFFLGNFKVKGHRLLPNVFGFDLIFFILIFLTSFSGGLSSTMASLIAPKKVIPTDRGRITTILSASSLLGNLLGSIISSIFAFILNKTH